MYRVKRNVMIAIYRTWFNIFRFYWKWGFSLCKKFIQHNLKLHQSFLSWCLHHNTNMSTVWGEGYVFIFLGLCKTIKPPNCQLAPKQVLYLWYILNINSVMHKCIVKKCCACFAIFMFGVCYLKVSLWRI